jgi:hypothetical protein
MKDPKGFFPTLASLNSANIHLKPAKNKFSSKMVGARETKEGKFQSCEAGKHTQAAAKEDEKKMCDDCLGHRCV